MPGWHVTNTWSDVSRYILLLKIRRPRLITHYLETDQKWSSFDFHKNDWMVRNMLVQGNTPKIWLNAIMQQSYGILQTRTSSPGTAQKLIRDNQIHKTSVLEQVQEESMKWVSSQINWAQPWRMWRLWRLEQCSEMSDFGPWSAHPKTPGGWVVNPAVPLKNSLLTRSTGFLRSCLLMSTWH